MASASPFPSRTWAAATSTPSRLPTTATAALWQCAVTGSTSSTRHWPGATRALARRWSLCGGMIRACLPLGMMLSTCIALLQRLYVVACVVCLLLCCHIAVAVVVCLLWYPISTITQRVVVAGQGAQKFQRGQRHQAGLHHRGHPWGAGAGAARPGFRVFLRLEPMQGTTDPHRCPVNVYCAAFLLLVSHHSHSASAASTWPPALSAGATAVTWWPS